MLLKPESPTSFPPVFCLKKLVISLKRASLCLEQKKNKEQSFSGTCQSVWNYSCISMNVQMWRLDLGGDKWGVGWCEWEGRGGECGGKGDGGEGETGDDEAWEQMRAPGGEMSEEICREEGQAEVGQTWGNERRWGSEGRNEGEVRTGVEWR